MGPPNPRQTHYIDVIMTTMASQITSPTVVCLFRRWSKKKSKLRVTGLLRGSHRGQVNSPHKWPVTRKMFPSDDVIVWNHNHNTTKHNKTVCIICGRYSISASFNSLSHHWSNAETKLVKEVLIKFGYSIKDFDMADQRKHARQPTLKHQGTLLPKWFSK